MVGRLCLALTLCQVCYGMNLSHHWISWKIEHSKTYSTVREETWRRTVWEQNVVEIMKHNVAASAGWYTYNMGTNHLTDMTTDEVNMQMNGLRLEHLPRDGANDNFTYLSEMLLIPSTVDWTEKGLVSPVENQGPCGSCWAFSAVGALEGQMRKHTGVLVPLSPQNLVDCSVAIGNHGCRGGYLSKAFTYIAQNKGIDSDCFYPYEHRDGRCRYTLQGRAGYCSGFRILPRNNELALMHAVATVGPVSVGMNANLPSFHRYRSGIYNDPLCNSRLVNHAVLVVGYGTENEQDYWLIKNRYAHNHKHTNFARMCPHFYKSSGTTWWPDLGMYQFKIIVYLLFLFSVSWGITWGEKGFFRVPRNKNQCGIATFAIYPTL
ncbi:cathepsin S, ortholog 1 isoform X2 [Brachyhypopomus gauderio]|uniref:cathepsin S, ortholog 1 isoform X2 n=1 Tax=Brachyhypopomus gauderio TaxID=698409 RepID=UPI004041E7CC